MEKDTIETELETFSWISTIVGQEVSPQMPISLLTLLLCRTLKKIDSTIEIDVTENLPIINLISFFDGCRLYGIEEKYIFEPEEITEEKGVNKLTVLLTRLKELANEKGFKIKEGSPQILVRYDPTFESKSLIFPQRFIFSHKLTTNDNNIVASVLLVTNIKPTVCTIDSYVSSKPLQQIVLQPIGGYLIKKSLTSEIDMREKSPLEIKEAIDPVQVFLYLRSKDQIETVITTVRFRFLKESSHFLDLIRACVEVDSLTIGPNLFDDVLVREFRSNDTLLDIISLSLLNQLPQEFKVFLTEIKKRNQREIPGFLLFQGSDVLLIFEETNKQISHLISDLDINTQNDEDDESLEFTFPDTSKCKVRMQNRIEKIIISKFITSLLTIPKIEHEITPKESTPKINFIKKRKELKEIQKEIQEEKERLAKEKMAEKMRQIEIAKEEAERTGAQLFGSRGVFRGGFGNDTEETGPTNYTMEMEKHISTDPPMITTRAYNNTNTNMQKSQNQPEKKIPSKGMKLVVQKQSNILAALKDEGEIEEFEKPQIQQQQENEPNTLEQEQQNQPDFPRKDVHFDVYEILTATLSKDGGLQNMEVSGSLDLFITNKDKTPLVIKLSKEKNPEKMIFRTHPHINKNLFQSENTLVLKDNSKPFPANGSQIPVLKWKWDNSDFTKIPLFLNCWPTNSGDTTSVNVEYSLEQKSFELHDVVALIPVPQSPVIEEVVGNYSYDHKQKILTWEIPLIDSSNQSGTIEFTIPKCNHSSLFPILLKFKSPNIYANLSVDSVLVVKDEEQNPTEFSQRQLLSTSSFSIN
eukprot:Anaeramoba_ignava/a433_117.p1 GENE.a433_117~~a433_117.p1  ORF type:complete len:841 (-),score=274.77 a433_117:191-2617(-)